MLERKYSFGEGKDGMVIHGDNLLALTPPVAIDEAYKEVLEQAENFRKYAG